MSKTFYPEFISKYYSESTIAFIKTIAHRIYRYNKNALIITCGPSGSGKSYVDLELLRGIYAYVNGEFPPDDYVVNRCFFKLKDFLEILNHPELQDQNKSRGQMFISEEIGTQASNRTYQNIANRTYSFIVQTFRAKGMIMFFNVPSFNFVDSQIRKQLHYLIETKMIDKKRNECICKVLELQYNSRMDKLYFHNFICETSNHEYIEIDLTNIPKIPDSLQELYEKKKTEFINELNKGLQNSLAIHDEKENRINTSKLNKLKGIQPQVRELALKGYGTCKIAEILKKSPSEITRIKQSIERKGYSLEKPQEKPVFDTILTKQSTPKLNFVTSES